MSSTQCMTKFFTAIAASGMKVDRANRRINGIAIASKGIANGDLFDDQTLATIAQLGNAGRVRARYDHPNRANPGEIEQTLDNLLGDYANWRVDGDVVRADAQFAGVNLDKENTVLDFAEKAPHLFGVSVVIDVQAPAKGTKPQKNAPCRPVALFAADFVDLPSSNTAGLFAAKAAEGSPAMDPVDLYAKDGKLFCTYKGEEVPVTHTPESIAATKAQMKALKAEQDDDDTETEAKKKAMELQNQPAAQASPAAATLTQADIEKAKKEALESERAYRKTFSTVLKSTGLTGKAADEFEETFYGQDEKTLKFHAKQILAARGKGLGESNADENSDEGKQPTELQKLEKEAGDRFDAEPAVRSMYGMNLRDVESPEYKTARGRHVAAARTRYHKQREAAKSKEE